jgi:hypothetical protein
LAHFKPLRLIAPDALGHVIASTIVAIAASTIPWETVISWLVETLNISRDRILPYFPEIVILAALGVALTFWRKWMLVKDKLLESEEKLKKAEAGMKVLEEQFHAINRKLSESQLRQHELEFAVAKMEAE